MRPEVRTGSVAVCAALGKTCKLGLRYKKSRLQYIDVDEMASKSRPTGTKMTYKLDTKPYMDMVRQTGELAHKALAQYGERRMPLTELRREVDQQLHVHSLSEWLL